MKKSKIRFLAVILALCLSVFCGCGASGGKDGKTLSDETAPTENINNGGEENGRNNEKGSETDSKSNGETKENNETPRIPFD